MFMDKKYINAVAPLIKDKINWDAFLAILIYEESKVIAELKGPKSAEDLIRTNAKYTLLQHLKNLRENVLNAEHEFSS